MTAATSMPFSDDPRYYKRFNLAMDPFPVGTDNIFLLTPQISFRLERIKEAIAGSHKLVVVTSSPGAGKSTVADYLQSHPEENWKISLVQAEANMGKDKLAQAIVMQAFPDKADKTSMAISLLHKYLELASRSNFVPVFIIDDADKLSLETLKFLLELATLRYAEALFRIVLFADESLIDKLDDQALNNLAAGMVFSLHLPSLSSKQVVEYIDTRLNAAGEITDNPFDEAAIDYIYRASGGLPAGVNLAARRILQPVSNVVSARGGYGKIAIGVAAAAIASLILYFYVLQGTAVVPVVENTTIEQSTPAPVQMETAVEALPGTGTLTPVMTEPVADPLSDQPDELLQTNSESVAVDEANRDASATLMPAEGRIPDEDIASEPEQVTGTPVATATPPEPATADTIAQDTSSTAPELPVPTPAIPATAPGTAYPVSGANNIFNLQSVPAILTGIRGSSWFRSQARTAYTLQLISASEVGNVLALLEAGPGIQAELSGYVKYTPSGRPRYLMFYGIYPDQDSAAAAVAGLPAGLQKVNPWPRSIGNITDEIDTVVLPAR